MANSSPPGRLETDGAEPRQAQIIGPRHIEHPFTIGHAPIYEKQRPISSSRSAPVIHTQHEEVQQQLENLKITQEDVTHSDTETLLVAVLEYMNRLYHQNLEGDTNLHLAVLYEETAQISTILQNTLAQSYLDIQNALGQTSLHVAVAVGGLEVARSLLVCGVDPGLVDTAGRTALHIACEKGDLDAVKALTEPLVSYEERMADDLKFRVRRHCLTKRPTRDHKGQECVHIAARAGRTDIVDHLVNKCGHDINAQEALSGSTVLHIAVATSNAQLAQYVLYHPGTDPSVQNYAGHDARLLAHYHPDVLAVVHRRYPQLRDTLWESFVQQVDASDADDSDTIPNGF